MLTCPIQSFQLINVVRKVPLQTCVLNHKSPIYDLGSCSRQPYQRFLSLCTALPEREVDDDGDPCHRNSLLQPTSCISTDFNGNSRYACFFWFIHNVLLTTSSALKNQTEFPHSRFSVCLRLKISNTLTNGNFIVEKLTSWSTMLPTICI